MQAQSWRGMFAAAALGLVIMSSAHAQLGLGGGAAAPAVAPVAGGIPAAVVTGAPPVVGATEIQPGILQKVCARLTSIRRGLCASPAGQLLNGASKPLTAITGGVIPAFCPSTPTDADTKKPGVAGAAAAAKKEALEAKERQAAVRYLGTLDCRYYPDAAGSLAAALRTDGSECVRYEASLMLGRGCCCNQKTIAALQTSMAGTEEDGNPAERSVRVRCAAAAALERCLSCYTPPAPEEEPKEEEKPMGEKPPTGEQGPRLDKNDSIPLPEPNKLDKTTKMKPEQKLPTRAQAERAARALAAFQNQMQTAQSNIRQVSGQANDVSVFSILKLAAEEMGPLPTVLTGQPTVVQSPIVAAQPKFNPSMQAKLTTPMFAPPQAFPAREPVFATPVAKAPAVSEPQLQMPAIPEVTVQTVEANAPVGEKVEAVPAPVPATVEESKPIVETVPAPETLPPLVPAVPEVQPAPVVAPAPVVEQPAPAPAVAPAPVPVIAPVPAPAMPANADDLALSTGKHVGGTVSAVANMVETGKTSAERHGAIRELVQHDWTTAPQVIPALLTAARSDTDRVVRVDALRHIVAYKMYDTRVNTMLTELVSDTDSWIAKEAADALKVLESEKK